MSLETRDLLPEEFALLATIDRSEHIDGHYVNDAGTMRLVEDDVDVPGWDPDSLPSYVARLQALHDAGGVVLGTWDGDVLIALASLDVTPVGGDPALLNLDMLHVSAGHRHLGVGRRLVQLITERARELGATRLYISATPTRNTVEAYQRLGAILNPAPEPHLLELEPNDIHLILEL